MCDVHQWIFLRWKGQQLLKEFLPIRKRKINQIFFSLANFVLFFFLVALASCREMGICNNEWMKSRNQPKFPVAFRTCLMLRFVYSFLVFAIKTIKKLMKAYSIFTVEWQPETFEKHAERFRLVHLSLSCPWLLAIFYHETHFTRRYAWETTSTIGAYTLPYMCCDLLSTLLIKFYYHIIT